MKALGARKWDILVKIGIPRSMPYLFASLKVAITLAYVGSVIAESNASRYGIGNLITRASADFNVPLVFAAPDRARHPRRHHLRRDRRAGAPHDRLGPPLRHEPGLSAVAGWVDPGAGPGMTQLLLNRAGRDPPPAPGWGPRRHWGSATLWTFARPRPAGLSSA